ENLRAQYLFAPPPPLTPPHKGEGKRETSARRLRRALLLHVPEYRRGRGQDAGDVLARGDRLIPTAEPAVGDALALARLHRVRDLLLRSEVGSPREGVAQPLHLRIARPAEVRLVAAGVDEARHHRVEDVGGNPRGEHAVPAAGVSRVLLGPA